MAWDDIFDDLEVHFLAQVEEEKRALAAEAERLRVARVTLRDRLRAVGSSLLTLETAAGSSRGHIVDVGADWIALTDARERAVFIPLSAVTSVAFDRGDLMRSLQTLPEDETFARMTVGYVLRSLARRRTPLTVMRQGAASVTGTIDRAGADHIDLARHDLDVPRREQNVRAIVSIPFAQIAQIVLEQADELV